MESYGGKSIPEFEKMKDFDIAILIANLPFVIRVVPIFGLEKTVLIRFLCCFWIIQSMESKIKFISTISNYLLKCWKQKKIIFETIFRVFRGDTQKIFCTISEKFHGLEAHTMLRNERISCTY